MIQNLKQTCILIFYNLLSIKKKKQKINLKHEWNTLLLYILSTFMKRVGKRLVVVTLVPIVEDPI